MPIHDWTRVETAAFHDFHQTWIVFLKNRMNGGLLPPGYFANVERHMGQYQPDILTLFTPSQPTNGTVASHGSNTGGVAVAVRPPKAVRQLQAVPTRRSTVAIRLTENRRLIALVELASASNKDRHENVTAYVEKASAALQNRVHVVHLDVLPPTKFTPVGLGGAIWSAVNGDDYPFAPEQPLAADSFRSGDIYDLYANPLAVGDELPEVPLFLSEGFYVNLPLAVTYESAFQSIAPQDRELLSQP